MKNRYFIVLLLFSYSVLHAQDLIKYDYQIPMGYFFGDLPQFQFNTFDGITKVDTTRLAFEFFATHSSICDSNGQLLLYSNGIYLANGDHEIIEGGDSILLYDHIVDSMGSSGLNRRIPQGALILPNPSNNGIYYLFHEEYQSIADPYFGNLHWHIKKVYLTTIDMLANEGKGKVIEKNKVLVQRDSLMDKGRILANRHANGRDWWVIIPHYSGNHFSKFLVTPEGVLHQPDIVVEQNYYPSSAPEQAAFSPDGIKYVTSGYKLNPLGNKRFFYQYDFDRCTGNLTNQVITQLDNEYLWGLYFSPNSKYLYWTHNNQSDVTQFDLSHPNWLEEGVQIYDFDYMEETWLKVPAFGWHVPSGQIIISCGNGINSYHRIDAPNKYGHGSNFQKYLDLVSYNGFTLPNIPNYRLGPLDGSACDTLGLDNNPVAWWRWELDTTTTAMTDVTFTDLSYFEPSTWLWDFGDGTTSQDTSPVHLFPYPDTFQVCLTVTNSNSSSTFCRDVVAGQVSSVVDIAGGANRGILSLQPNPASTQVQVNLTLPDGFEGQLQVMDVLGRTYTTQPVQAQQQVAFSTAHWQRGVYLCLLKDREGRVQDMARLLIH
jgi:PKD domain